jgi:hypothetical protein
MSTINKMSIINHCYSVAKKEKLKGPKQLIDVSLPYNFNKVQYIRQVNFILNEIRTCLKP